MTSWRKPEKLINHIIIRVVYIFFHECFDLEVAQPNE